MHKILSGFISFINMKSRLQKIVLAMATAAAIAVSCGTSYAYILPDYEMSAEERAVPAESNLARYQERLDRMAEMLPLGVIENRRRNHNTKLSPRERRAIAEYEETKIAHTFWSYVASLKRDLISLHGDESAQQREVEIEADAMAKAVIQVIYKLSQEYRVSISALVQNFLINTGHKEKGFCYHYVNDIRNALKKYDWRYFDLHWGEAWPQTYKESNALVVTAKGKRFETGIAIDAWRSAGKPFWTPVKGDRFPWHEAFNVDRDYVVE